MCATISIVTGRLSQIHFFDNAEADPLMHYNIGNSEPEPLRTSQVTESIARVMGLPSPVGTSFTNLPAYDIFNSARLNLVLALDGTADMELPQMLTSGNTKYTFEVEKPKSANIPLVLDALGETLEHPFTSFQRAPVVCASGASWFLNSRVCKGGLTIPALEVADVCYDEISTATNSAITRAGYKVTPSLSQDGACPTLTLSNDAGDVDFDMNNQADRAFFEELELLAQLPVHLAELAVSTGSPALAIVGITSVEGIFREHGFVSAKTTVVSQVIDSSAARFLEEVFALLPQKVVGQIVQTPAGTDTTLGYLPWAQDHRALAGNSTNGTVPDSGNSTGNGTAISYTIEQISEYQICLWTAVGLIASVFAAIMMTAFMTIEPDNILYAKFQADTSGLKND